MMKLLRVVAVLAATVGMIAFVGRVTTVGAASGGGQAGGARSPTSQPLGKSSGDADGAEVYANRCAICHGYEREGILPAFPPLMGLQRRMTETQVTDIIHTGKGRMPGFPFLDDDDLSALLHFLMSNDAAGQAAVDATGVNSSGGAVGGAALFKQNCAFCHGRDATGGETGPDLTRSKLVLSDRRGDKISDVVRNGRLDKKMPAFSFSDQELQELAAFIHEAAGKAASRPGGRKGVDVADLQTGNVEAGKRYFNGVGTCATCHSPTGDLAGIASRYEGLQLEERMLYPRDVKSRVTVTLPTGEQVAGELAYRDEFTVGMRDGKGVYRSWPTVAVKYKVDAPVEAHAALFAQYTDADIHNLMAYIQTLR